MNLPQEEETIKSIETQIEHLDRTVKQESKALIAVEQELIDAQTAQEILQHLSQATQNQVHQRLSKVVSSCLTAVFGDEAYEFKIEFDRKRGRTEARLLFTRNGMELDPLTASGGGMVDVAAFALRVACLVLHRPRLRRLVIADEPFRFVSAEYQPNVQTMLESLAEELNVQVIFVTHVDALVVGKIIQL